MDVSDVSEEDVKNSIDYREQLIERAQKIVALCKTMKANYAGVNARELVNLAKQLREHGIRCVQKIVAWTLANTEKLEDSNPKIFMYNGVEYLCKMYSDLDFIVEELNPKLSKHGGFAIGDPFFITKGGGDNAHKRAGTAATLVVIDAIERRRIMFDLEQEGIGNEEVFEEVDEVGARRNSTVVLQRKRRAGVTDLYKSPSSEDKAMMDARSNPILQTSPSMQENVIFRGRKLYRRGHKLGKGAYATVYACERQDGERFAVKVYDITASSSGALEDEDIKYARTCYNREVDIMRSLSHRNIIALEDSVVREGIPYVVMERMSCTLLEVQVDREGVSDMYGGVSVIERYALDVLEQLSGALWHMHSQNMIHRDIKPENILVTMSAKGVVAKLGDLGSAVQLPGKFGEHSLDFMGESDLTHYVGSRWYRAPETLGNGSDYGPPADIWSLGCTISEFITSLPLFEGSDEQEVFDSIISLFPDHLIPQGMESYLLERGLELKAGTNKRSIHHILCKVSSALRKVVECMVCMVADERYTALGIQRDVKELMVEA